MQLVLSRIWAHVAMSISYNNIHNTTDAFNHYKCTYVLIRFNKHETTYLPFRKSKSSQVPLLSLLKILNDTKEVLQTSWSAHYDNLLEQ